MSDNGFDLQEALDSTSVAGTLKNVLGIAYESKVCDCGSECRETHAYVPATAAFDGGNAPVWECSNEDCGKQYHREGRNDRMRMDLYGRE